MEKIKDYKISICIIISIIWTIVSIRVLSFINLMVEMYNLFNKTDYIFKYTSLYCFLISIIVVFNIIIFFYKKKILKILIIIPTSSLIINYKLNSSFLLNSNCSHSPFNSIYINFSLGLIITYFLILIIVKIIEKTEAI